MESFRVICETCRARLKVRSESVIGEIHACPKCGSMVQILPPAGWETISTEASVVQIDSVVESAQEATTPRMEFIEAAPPPVPSASTLSPFVFWGVGGTILLLLGLTVGIWAGGSEAGDDSAAVGAVAAAKSASEDSVGRAPDPLKGAAGAADEPAQADAAGSDLEPVAKTQAGDMPVMPGLPELPSNGEEPAGDGAELASGQSSESRERSESHRSAASPTLERRQSPVLKFDPLDFDPDRLSLPRDPASAAAASAGSIEDNLDHGVETDAEPAVAEDAAEMLLPPPAHDETLHVRLGPIVPSAPAGSGNGEQLAVRVQSFAVSDMPLNEFVDTVSEMAGVPITLDPVAVKLAGVSPRASVSVEANNVTLEKLLGDALSSHRLELVERGGHLSVALAGGARWRSVDYEVKDLVEGSDAKAVAGLIERFVAPAAWQAAGGKGTLAVDGTKLRVEQTQAVHHETLIFCERLRLARGLTPRSRYPAERLAMNSPYEAIAAKLNKRATFTFLPWARLRSVLHYWQQESGLTILVDWSKLAEEELGPSTPVACAAVDRPWLEALDRILQPLGLAWWAVDGETIQITSRDALDGIQRVEFYLLPDSLRNQFASGDALLESLAMEMRDRDGAGEPTSLTMDELSGRLIVLGPPTWHRNLDERLRAKAE